MFKPADALFTADRCSFVALLADRDEDGRSMYAQYLRMSEWDAIETSDGRDALALALARNPAMLVTGPRLLGLDGYDLCRLLRHDVDARSIPIIMLTADAFEADVDRAYAAGADVVLTKPCLPDALLDQMRRLREQAVDVRQRATRAQTQARVQVGRAQAAMAKSMLSRTYPRYETTTPSLARPLLMCPKCDAPLIYQSSFVGGVSPRHPEQWDRMKCKTCGVVFEYRQRTKRLRAVS